MKQRWPSQNRRKLGCTAVTRDQYRLSLQLAQATAEGSSSYGSKRDSFLAEAWRLTSMSKRAVGRAVSAMESSGVVFNFWS